MFSLYAKQCALQLIHRTGRRCNLLKGDHMKVTRFALILAVLLSTAAIKAGAADKDIIDTAVAAGSFNPLATALQAADLIDALKGEGPFTVFAPTDDAFKKLPAGTL